MSALVSACNDILRNSVERDPGVPGVAAIVTDRTGNVYEGAVGNRKFGGDVAITPDSVFALFSTTKAITGTLCLQLAEAGLLDLDAPAKTYLPALGEVQVLEGFDPSGRPRLRPPTRDITMRMLLLHTAGFGYESFNEHYRRLVEEHGQPSVITATQASINAPLLFEPGSDWEYGVSMDWAGRVVEAITGQRLGEVMRDKIFEPLEMSDTAFTMNPSMQSRYVTMHQRDANGGLSRWDDFLLPQSPELHMGGHGLHSTPLDYAKFIRMWLNDGDGPNGRVLRPDTICIAERNGLGNMKIKKLAGVISSHSNDAEFFPGMSKSWGLTFMINDEDAPTGRPAGSLSWAGLGNLYYWIDRKNGIGGFWATQILPFADSASLGGYLDFETAVYNTRLRSV